VQGDEEKKIPNEKRGTPHAGGGGKKIPDEKRGNPTRKGLKNRPMVMLTKSCEGDTHKIARRQCSNTKSCESNTTNTIAALYYSSPSLRGSFFTINSMRLSSPKIISNSL
jgi:hypothetical protein